MFHSEGAAYDRKKRRCVLRMPRHQAERIRIPDMGNMICTSVTVRSRPAPEKPGATKSVITGARTMPMSASAAVSSTRTDAMTELTRLASAVSPRSIMPAYTGMNEAESVPSPSRLRMTLGMRSAARNASAAAPSPK
jgi:hypothetical protein